MGRAASPVINPNIGASLDADSISIVREDVLADDVPDDDV